MSAGFKERSQRVLTMLRQPNTSFLLICAPEPASLSQVDRFFTRLTADGMPIGGVIINRVHQADAIADETSYSLTEDDLAAISTAPDRAPRRHRSDASTARGVPRPTDARGARSRRDRSNRLVARGTAGASRAAFRSRSAQPRRHRCGGGVPAARTSVEHCNRSDITLRHRERSCPNTLRAEIRLDVAGTNDFIEAQPAHCDETAPDRFRCRFDQRERDDRARPTPLAHARRRSASGAMCCVFRCDASRSTPSGRSPQPINTAFALCDRLNCSPPACCGLPASSGAIGIDDGTTPSTSASARRRYAREATYSTRRRSSLNPAARSRSSADRQSRSMSLTDIGQTASSAARRRDIVRATTRRSRHDATPETTVATLRRSRPRVATTSASRISCVRQTQSRWNSSRTLPDVSIGARCSARPIHRFA